MTTTPHRHRDPVTQECLNQHMRRPEVLQHLLFQALHAEPASPEQVKEFLATAPPEVFVALDGLLPLPAQGFRDESVHEHPIVRGFVGCVLSHRSER